MRRALPASLALLYSVAALADGGRLLATGGVTAVEGGAGGGIVPWAVLAGYGTGDEAGATAFATWVDTGDYRLGAVGAAWTWRNRIELSASRHTLELPTLAARLALPAGTELGQDVFGAKLRLAGDLVYGAWPQIAVGLQHKRQRDFDVPAAVGARDDSGTDVYVAASRLFLAATGGRNLLVNATVRHSRANQLGLLGFGGDAGDDAELLFETSVAVFADRRTAFGFEYRQKPDNLSFAGEDDWADVFVAWFPSKRLALTAAWAELGSIAGIDEQNGFYVSVQGSF